LKKYFIAIALIAIVAACNNEVKKDPIAEKPKEDLSANPDYQKGLELIAKSNCLTCHKISEKLVGPAYRDIANKYTADENNISMLADKIIKGGSGVWGQIPMLPHPEISKADAEQMAKYVLLLKNK